MKNTTWLFAILLLMLAMAACSSDGGGPCTDHKWGAWNATVAATCVATGEGTRNCVHCGAEDPNTIIPIDPAAHEFGSTWHLTTPAGHHNNSSADCSTGIYTNICDLCHASGASHPADYPCLGTVGLSISGGVVTGAGSAAGANYLCFPDSVTGIGDYAFYNNFIVRGVMGGANITAIGDLAFYGSYNLREISLPKVSTIGNNAFDGCLSLRTACFPLATSIGNYAFSSHPNLQDVTLGATSITGPGAGTMGFSAELVSVYNSPGRYTRTPPSTVWTKVAP